MPAEPKDLLLVEMIVQMGFATRQAMDEALDLLEGEGFKRPLTELLIEKGTLSKAQMDLVDKFMDREPEKLPGDSTDEEKEFGHLVEMKRLAASGDVAEALELLETLRSEGKYARLGEILLRKTMLTAAEVHQVLAEKGIRIMRCNGCSKKAEVKDFDEAKSYKCRSCGGALAPVELHEVPVADDGMDVVVVEEE